MTLVIVDLGYGNIGSIRIAFERLGAAPLLSADPAEIEAAERLILPGVGAAGQAMAAIGRLGIADTLREFPRPLLGICLGMQLLFEGSEEDEAPCLGILPGKVRRLDPAPGLPVPHMGWSRLGVSGEGAGLAEGDYVYFAHSFACDDGPCTIARAEHSRPVPAAVRRGNVTGAQFHPERSGEVGARFLQSFMAS
ncbi:MAG TPA: imidazole glycerol phosphate synthase subunit HisH [Allosphingosinicella sp.]